LTPDEANSRAHAQADLAREALEDAAIRDERASGYLEDLAEFVITREH
jgi:geranylgeranyl pyrophosphate synthase